MHTQCACVHASACDLWPLGHQFVLLLPCLHASMCMCVLEKVFHCGHQCHTTAKVFFALVDEDHDKL